MRPGRAPPRPGRTAAVLRQQSIKKCGNRHLGCATSAHGRALLTLVQCPPMRAVGSHPGTDLTVSVSCDEGVALVALGGRLDADTVAVVRGQIEQLLEEGSRELLVDMAGVQLLDYTAARALVDAARWTRALGGTLHVFHVEGQPRELFQRLALRVVGPLLSVSQAA